MQSMTYINGNILPTEQACVPVLDRGFLYGDSIYEVFSTHRGIPLFYAKHWERLLNSAQLCGMQLSLDYWPFFEAVRQTVQQSGASSAQREVYVRYIITRGEGAVDLYPQPNLQARTIIMVKELPGWNEAFYRVGISAAIPAVRRNPIDALDPNIKGGNYLNNVIAVSQARELGAQESIILNRENQVTEASNSNVFFVLQNRLATPSSTAGNLRGLTKTALLEALSEAGIQVEERVIEADELNFATECFITSATRGVMPVSRLRLENGDWQAFPAGGGELTQLAMHHYNQYVAQHLSDNKALCLW